MKQETYQEEINQILQAFYSEKRRTKEQEARLQELGEELEQAKMQLERAAPTDEHLKEIQKLQHLLSFFKTKYEQTARALNERTPRTNHEEFEALQKQIDELKKQIIEQETVNAALRNSLEGQEDTLQDLRWAQQSVALNRQEMDDLRQELLASQRKAADLEQEKNRQKKQLERLAFALEEKENRKLESEQLEFHYRKSKEYLQELEIQLRDSKQLNAKQQEQIEVLTKDLKDAKEHHAQLERVIQFLRERSEETQLELHQFRTDYQAALDQIKSLTDFSHQLESECVKKSTLAADLAQEVKNQEEEMQALQQQLAVLRSIALEADPLRAQSIEQEARLRELEETLEGKRQELIACQEQLLQSEQREQDQVAYQEEVRKQLEGSHQQALDDLYQEQAALQRKVEELESVKEQLQAALCGLEETRIREEELTNSLQQAQQVIHELQDIHQRDIDLIALKDESLGSLQGQLEGLQNEKLILLGEMEKAQALTEEKDGRLKVAQQHLAKKVKEVNELTERIEDVRMQLTEGNAQLNQSRVQVGELRTQLEMQTAHEKRLQEQLQESIRANESLADRAETKYYSVYVKWQEAERKVNELRQLESRYLKMQEFYSGFGQFVNTPHSFNQQPEDPFPVSPPRLQEAAPSQEREIPEPPPPFFEPESPPADSSRHFKDLFDLPMQTPHKQNLFD